MQKRTFYLVLISLTLFHLGTEATPDRKVRDKAEKLMASYPDSLYIKAQPGNLLDEGLYLQLAEEGWTSREIFRITDDFAEKHRAKMRGTSSFSAYTKEWKPYWNMLLPNDTMKKYMDPEYDAELSRKVRQAFPAAADEYQPRVFYTPDDRLRGVRNTGYFRHNVDYPSGGRIHWIQAHPTNPDKLMVIPDGDAIWRTNDNGRTWDPVTDRIPDRFHRSVSNGYAIPVNPDDWNHFFAFMGNGNPVYETFDGGQTWERVPGATHKGFKRGYAFKDAADNLKFIGVERNTWTGWNGKLWVSDNKGVTWNQFIPTAEQMDIHPTNGSRVAWFQEFAFCPDDRNTVYIATSRGILRSTDGMAFVNNKFNVERMSFRVFNQNKTQVRSEGTSFPVPHSDGPMFIEIDPTDANKMWVAMGQKDSSPHHSAVFYSEDRGLTWITLRDTQAGIGSGQVFGNEAPGGWLGGFAVNFKDPKLVYGCSMSSAKSFDGGRTFSEYAWGHRMRGFHANGQLHHVSSARHNADNHMMFSTQSGRIFRASDAGLLMIDKNINGGEWTNISGDMGQVLFYKARVNEFGDMTIHGNTQDIDAQTYRYGRWGHWRGYEGSTAAINPISNETYYSGGGGGVIEGTSWGNSWIEGIGKADVATGNWYLWRSQLIIGPEGQQRDLGVVKDIGRSVEPINIHPTNAAATTRDFILCRDTTVGSSLLVLRNDGNIVRFDNESTSFTTIKRPTFAGYSGSCIAVNPDNVNEIYIGDNTNGILKTTNGGDSWERISSGAGGIPSGVSFNNLYYHEGSGDIYAVSNNSGIFLLKNGQTHWQLWMKGYNPAAFGGAQINYATQEMMIFDYGRGIWLADLETPSDRFFKNGFKIRQNSHVHGLRTFGIVTNWQIPMYYDYEWTVNGVVQQSSPYRTFTSSSVKPGDKVQLKLTLREAPDVSTLSEVITVGADVSAVLPFSAGRAIRSLATGRMDLGHHDFFLNDFTVEMWVKPMSVDGAVLIGNRKLDSRDQQGWVLALTGGNLIFKYAPRSVFSQPTYETTVSQDISVSAGAIAANQWYHIAVSAERNGNIRIYVNGAQRATQVRRIQESGLNSTQPLSLLADSYEYNAANATIDELRIWNTALSLEDVRRNMGAQPAYGDDRLVYYNSFNADNTSEQHDLLTRTPIRSRIRAMVSYPEMPLAIAADHTVYDTLTVAMKDILDGTEKVLSVGLNNTRSIPMNVSRFDNVYTASNIRGMSPDHFDVASYVYKLDFFLSPSASDSVEIKCYFPEAANFNGESIFMASADREEAVWKEVGEAIYSPADNAIVFKMKASEVNGQLIAFVKAKPAIALNITQASAQGVVPVFREGSATLNYTATLMKSLQAPSAPYKVSSTRGFVNPQPVTFGEGVSASSVINVVADSLGQFNEMKSAMLKGEDNYMIPYELILQNKIVQREQGTSISFNGGGATIGSAGDYAGLNNSNTVTMMGWVRIDDLEMLTASAVRPLIFFRGGGSTTGIHLQQGEIRCHWNEEGWSWGLSTGLRITADDIGRWMHIAMVTTPNSISFYLNGKKFTNSRAMSRTRVLSPLMLGRNNDGDTWFKGAFDQVLLFNRSLSDDEVVNYMYERAYLDESGLVANLSMDVRNETGVPVELRTNAGFIFGGTVDTNHRSTFPFNTVKQTVHSLTAMTDTAAMTSIQMPSGVSGKFYLSHYNHLPYNYNLSGLVPVSKRFFSVNYLNNQSFNSVADSVTLVCRHASILTGDELHLALRQLGSESKFTIKATALARQDGKAIARVRASELTEAYEGIWMTSTANLPEVTSYVEGARIPGKAILKNDALGVPVTFERTSDRKGGVIDLIVRESAIAHFDESSIELSETNKVTRTLIIDRSKLNPMAYNEIQVTLIGANAEPLTMQVALEPTLELTLLNGTSENQITATNDVLTLKVKAELIQGVLEDAVGLTVAGDLEGAVSIGTGYLTSGSDHTYSNLRLATASNPVNQGWNSVSNPYLVNFLLSKRENKSSEGVSPFMYRYLPVARNFVTYDTRYLDTDMWVRPFEPFMVQVDVEDPSLTLHAAGKSSQYNRRNTDYFVMSQVQEVEIEMWLNDELHDRTGVRFESGASMNYVFGEDAPKLPGLDILLPQFYSLGTGNRYSLQSLPPEIMDVQLGVRTFRAGTYTFRVSRVMLGPSTTLQFVDETTGQVIPINSKGDLYTVDLPSTTSINESRFKIRVTTISSVDVLQDTGINIWAEYNTCHIAGLAEGAVVTIHDISGRRIMQQEVNENHFSTRLPAGIYAVSVENQGNLVKGKIIIHQ
jgi:photosystem II stability/assembly factor-like uncharacterized protein